MGCTGRESVDEKETQKINKINGQKENKTNVDENKNKEEFGLEAERRKEDEEEKRIREEEERGKREEDRKREEEERRKREEEERRKKEEEERREKEEEEKIKKEEEERRKKELIKTKDEFIDVYVFSQDEFKNHRNWDRIKICKQVEIYFTRYSYGYSYQYGYIHELKEDPEVKERRQKRREEEYRKQREEEEKLRKIREKEEEEREKREFEEKLNSFPFIKDHIRILPETYSSKHEIAIHFGHSEGPIAPKDDGGYYLAYYNSKDSNLHVLEFSSEDELINDFNTKYKAYPHDITTTSKGFALYLVNSSNVDHSFLVSYDKDGKKLWDNVIMNNKNPKKKRGKPVTQITDPNNGFGMNCIFEATNAKLGFSNNKIALIFSHYNNFDFKNDCHTGDTFCTFDLETGRKYDFAWSWNTSHSLVQSMVFDGKYWITSALGDAYPQGITLSAIDSTEPISPKKKRSSIIDKELFGKIVGQFNGNSYGKMASIIPLNEPNLYGLIYSVTPSKEDPTDKIALKKFKFENKEFVKVDDITLKTGFQKSMCNVRCGKLGDDIIVITYITDESLSDCTHFWIRGEIKMYFLVIDFNGNILEDFESPLNYQNVSDDLRQLKDKSLRWTHIDDDGTLKIIKAIP